MQNELYFYFKDVKRITEIYSIARDLKQKGFDAAKINVVVAEKKKELIAKTNSIKTLLKGHQQLILILKWLILILDRLK